MNFLWHNILLKPGKLIILCLCKKGYLTPKLFQIEKNNKNEKFQKFHLKRTLVEEALGNFIITRGR